MQQLCEGESPTLGAGSTEKFCALFLSGLRVFWGRSGWITHLQMCGPAKMTSKPGPSLLSHVREERPWS
jgi:hypothetical protein